MSSKLAYLRLGVVLYHVDQLNWDYGPWKKLYDTADLELYKMLKVL